MHARAVAGVAGHDVATNAARTNTGTGVARFLEIPGNRGRELLGNGYAWFVRREAHHRPTERDDKRQRDDVENHSHTEKVTLVTLWLPMLR